MFTLNSNNNVANKGLTLVFVFEYKYSIIFNKRQNGRDLCYSIYVLESVPITEFSATVNMSYNNDKNGPTLRSDLNIIFKNNLHHLNQMISK